MIDLFRKYSAIAAVAAALISMSPDAHATADGYGDCLKAQGVNNPSLDPNMLLQVGKNTAQMLSEGFRPDAISSGLVHDGMTSHLAGAIVTCAPKVGLDASSGAASGSTCNSAACVPNIDRTAVANGTCSPKVRYDFGMDSAGRPYVCLSGGSWAATPPLIGVRTMGTRCSGLSTAQSPDGIAMSCMDGVWEHGVDIPA